MAVESDEDRAVFVEDFGVEITWTRGDTPLPVFLAIFDRPTVIVEHEPEAAGTLSRVATLSCPEASLPAGATEDDRVSVADVDEEFACSTIRPDGTGWCVVDLKRV